MSLEAVKTCALGISRAEAAIFAQAGAAADVLFSNRAGKTAFINQKRPFRSAFQKERPPDPRG
ncbi:hypothetical protein [Polaromonas sp.]|uniref:hypothetical protein n=1 Tax=Polaromonas sp. TaxID=1869339 RepID=UPI0037529D8E